MMSDEKWGQVLEGLQATVGSGLPCVKDEAIGEF